MKLRYLSSLFVFILIIYACGNTDKLNENSSTDRTQITKTLTGRGAETQRITLNEGAAIFKYNYSGPRNFIIWLKDNNAKNIALIVNDIDATSGSKSVNIKTDGTYILDVEAEGNWSIEIK